MQAPSASPNKSESHIDKAYRLHVSAEGSLAKHLRTRIKAVVDTDDDVLRGITDFLKSKKLE